jgi:tRNA U34 2-thiouridine synthase MnmA/TrmU
MITERNMIKSKPTVLLGMSGGVDSSTTAYLLKKQGFSVMALLFQCSMKMIQILSRM